MQSLTTISLTRHLEPDWLVRDALMSLAPQRDTKGSILFIDQSPNQAMRRLCRELSGPQLEFRYIEAGKQGLSEARNLAIAQCQTDVLLYLDVDAVAAPDWASQLRRSLTESGAVVTGGRIVPRWHRRPLLASRSRLVCEQYSLLDLGPDVHEASRVVGANFGINRARIGEDAFFDESLGRRDGLLLGGEESDLCRRVASRGLKILYNGAAVVEHQILPERMTYRWLTRRFYFAGLNRAIFGGPPQPNHKMGLWDLLAAPFCLVPYSAGYLRGRLAWT